MIFDLRLLIFEVKSWRSSGASFKIQNSSIINRLPEEPLPKQRIAGPSPFVRFRVDSR
jgi:hypothetical protein